MSPTICIHCSLVALANEEPPPGPFDETPAEHMKRVHPNGVSPAERQAVELRAFKVLQARNTGRTTDKPGEGE